MSPSSRPAFSGKAAALPLAAALILLSLTPPSFASIDRPNALTGTSLFAPKRCSGAFRYAARDGNDEILPLSTAQIVANERRLARTHDGPGFGVVTDAARLRSATAMCG